MKFVIKYKWNLAAIQIQLKHCRLQLNRLLYMHNGNKTYTKQLSFFVLFNISAAQQIMSSRT